MHAINFAVFVVFSLGVCFSTDVYSSIPLASFFLFFLSFRSEIMAGEKTKNTRRKDEIIPKRRQAK